MRQFMRPLLASIVVAGAVACDTVTSPIVNAPAGLQYVLDPSGDPDRPAGILLQWDPVLDDDLEVYNVYSRPGSTGSFDLRASTTSVTFHDVGVPDLEYYVTAVTVHGEESPPSGSVVVDERLRLNTPAGLSTTSLDGAIHLAWADNAFAAEPAGFRQYRVYSVAYDLDADLCGPTWSLEGTTVAPEFLAAALTNGAPRCFGVSAESVEGFESLWSDILADTPRPDGRNVLLFPLVVDANRSGFRFFDDANGDGLASRIELGIVGPGSSTAADFWLFRDAAGAVFLVPQRTGVTVAVYGSDPVADLTSIDVAPLTGFDRPAIEAVPGWGYVFEMPGADGLPRYGALRPTHVGADYVIFDWAYQTDPGNPQLIAQGAISQPLVVRR